MMHLSVINKWHEFSAPLEGRVSSMYVDVLGYITTAVGNLIDPISLAERLSWTFEDGSRADLAQVRADWHLLKAGAAHYAKLHWKYARAATKCRLAEQAIDNLVAERRAGFYEYLRRHHFPELDTYPADAQLAIMSMAWACGPGFPVEFKNFKRAVLARDWDGAAASCKIRDGLDTPSKADDNPGIVPRNKHNKFLLLNASVVDALGADPAVLWWPEVAAPGLATVPTAAAEAKSAAQAAMDHFVAVERERFLDRGASAARDIRDYEEPAED